MYSFLFEYIVYTDCDLLYIQWNEEKQKQLSKNEEAGKRRRENYIDDFLERKNKKILELAKQYHMQLVLFAFHLYGIYNFKHSSTFIIFSFAHFTLRIGTFLYEKKSIVDLALI